MTEKIKCGTYTMENLCINKDKTMKKTIQKEKYTCENFIRIIHHLGTKDKLVVHEFKGSGLLLTPNPFKKGQFYY